MPQKHPPASAAVCGPETVVSLASCAGAGTAAAAPALALQAVAPMSSPRESRTDLSDGLGMLLSPCSKYEGKSAVGLELPGARKVARSAPRSMDHKRR